MGCNERSEGCSHQENRMNSNNNLMLNLKLLSKKHTKPKACTSKDIIKIAAQIELETRKAMQRINDQRVGSLKG